MTRARTVKPAARRADREPQKRRDERQGGPERWARVVRKKRPGDNRGHEDPGATPGQAPNRGRGLPVKAPHSSMPITSSRTPQPSRRRGVRCPSGQRLPRGPARPGVLRHTRSFRAGSGHARHRTPAADRPTRRTDWARQARTPERDQQRGREGEHQGGAVLVHAEQRAQGDRGRRAGLCRRPRRAPLALVLLLHTEPSVSVHTGRGPGPAGSGGQPDEQLGAEQERPTPCGGGRRGCRARAAPRRRGSRAGATSAGRCRSCWARNCRTITSATTATITSALTSPDI